MADTVNRNMKVFAVQLKKARNVAGLTQKEAAEILKMPLQTYQHYELLAVTGRRNPDFETLVKIADAFGTTTDFLLGRG